MSKTLATEHVSYDGDFIYGYLQVNPWIGLAAFTAELDKQLAATREEALAEYTRLTALDDSKEVDNPHA